MPSFGHVRHLLSRLTNLCRAEWSYWLSTAGVISVHHEPVFVSIEPADFCQLRCPQCPVGMANRIHSPFESDGSQSSIHRHLLSLADYQHILSHIAPYAFTVQLFFQGEPLLNRDLPEMVRLARAEGLYVIISTNAQAMTPDLADRLVAAGLSRIIVSMDGASQASYSSYRVGGSVDKVRDALHLLRAAKERHHASTVIELQCLALSSNEHEWDTLRHTYRDLGADTFTLKTAQFYNFEHGNTLMPSNPRYSRYERINNNSQTSASSTLVYRLKRPVLQRLWARLFGLTPCRRLWFGRVITATGDILPCCFDKSAVYVFGNILQAEPASRGLHSFMLPRDSRYTNPSDFYRAVLHGSASIPICHNCTR